MSRFIFQTPGGAVRETLGEGDETVIIERTDKGDDFFEIYQLIAERSQTTDEKRREEIIRQLLPLTKAFREAWNEDPLDLIVEIFGDDGDGDE